MSARRVAVVGAGGQIGRTLLGRLASVPSIEVRGVCRNELTAAPLRLAGFDVRCGAVSDAAEARKLVGDCEVVLNCASASALPGTARSEERGILHGLLGTTGPRRLIHFSSVATYGSCITAHNRYERPRPDYPYGRDKLHLEAHLRELAGRSAIKEIVVLRMGHVYGAEQWVSRFVFDTLPKEGWRLPFGGRTASNAIHVKNVASAVLALSASGEVGTFNLFDNPQSTWRDVFDWHTSAIGAPQVPALEDDTSERLRAHFARVSRAPTMELVREVASWAKSLPISLASSSQQVRYVALSLMSALRSPDIDARIFKRFVGGHLARRRMSSADYPPWLFSDPAPGPTLDYPSEITADDAREVARWRSAYSSPDALAPFQIPAREGAEDRPEAE